MTDFANLTTVAEIDTTYKRLFRERSCVTDVNAYWKLSEAHRKALSDLGTPAATPRKPADPHRVMPKDIRRWAVQERIPLGKGGRITPHIKQSYREAHEPASSDMLPDTSGVSESLF